MGFKDFSVAWLLRNDKGIAQPGKKEEQEKFCGVNEGIEEFPESLNPRIPQFQNF